MWILYIVSFFFMTYALRSLIWPLRYIIKKRYILLLSFFIILGGGKYIIYQQFGSMFLPNLPPYIILVGEIIFISLFLMVLMALIKDIVLFILWIFKKSHLHNKQNYKLYMHIGIILSASIISIIGTLSQFTTPVVKAYDFNYPISSSSNDAPSLKIVQLTDLHLGPILQGDFLAKVVAKTNELEPDIVLITGDFVDGTVEKVGKEFLAFKDLKTRYGIYAVTGNHEYYSNAPSWVSYLTSLGINFLHNESIMINHHGAKIKILGVPDVKGVNFGDVKPSLSLARQNVIKYIPAHLKDKQEDVSVLMVHQPIIIKKHKIDASLVLAGHTHGGTMFFLQPLIARFNAGYVSGLYKVNDKTSIYVSNGTGIWAGFSTRILVPHEISLFNLHFTHAN